MSRFFIYLPQAASLTHDQSLNFFFVKRNFLMAQTSFDPLFHLFCAFKTFRFVYNFYELFSVFVALYIGTLRNFIVDDGFETHNRIILKNSIITLRRKVYITIF